MNAAQADKIILIFYEYKNHFDFLCI